MKEVNILFIGADEKMVSIVMRLINNHPEWRGISALSEEEARSQFAKENIQLVLFGAGIDEASEISLRKYFLYKQPGIIILQHYGGGSGLLSNEIRFALDGNN